MDTNTKDRHPYPPASPQAALRIARTVMGALVAGPLGVWAVAWLVTDGGTRPFGVANPGFASGHALLIWAVIAAGGFGVAMIFRGRALSAVEEGRRAGGASGVFARAGEVQSTLIVAMALLEGPALFAGVMFLLFGDSRILMYAAPVFLAGVALTFPRAEWFGVDERARRG